MLDFTPGIKKERRCQRLESFLKRLIRPPRTSFSSHGKVYPLPVRAQKPSSDIGMYVAKAELEYLAGFFDGDGCVHSNLCFRNRILHINQAESNVAVLLRFMKQFGGGIYRRVNIPGSRQYSFQWRLSGERVVRRVASLLAGASCVKREQLDVVALETPSCPRHRSRLANHLRSLKREAPGPCRDVSWAYLAGFFDAEGCIHIRSTSVHMCLSISQNFKESLCAVKSLIERTLPGIGMSLKYNRRGHYELLVCNTASSVAVLRQLLDSGLTAKQEQAMLALTLNRDNHTSIRESLSLLKGNQSRGTFLDAAGCERAKRIKIMTDRLYRSSSGQASHENVAAYLHEERDTLKREHKLRNVERRLTLLRKEIRSLLRQGARRPAG